MKKKTAPKPEPARAALAERQKKWGLESKPLRNLAEVRKALTQRKPPKGNV